MSTTLRNGPWCLQSGPISTLGAKSSPVSPGNDRVVIATISIGMKHKDNVLLSVQISFLALKESSGHIPVKVITLSSPKFL